ncbi:SMI1/KNR4 family protein [Sporosarcina sp. Marseille-Q4063]|uniref:SMI1/KNR4 family protein n=1 Tax=Sporosarcina sp. Marseille-Q4063 TaxID=2810514 RepID=UPI001BAEEFF0|nr:SMI1/KNR4 family protein [Sporosarcina sp. Marseille-Q4063]QUW20562.1 SMI1/KNR4 family protein [Sporosarcina sp. Marseille-Q4063]
MDWIFESINNGVTNEEIVAAQAKLGVLLPNDFLELMKKSNGGYINYDKRAFPIDFNIESGDAFIEVEEIMGVHEEGILLSEYLIQEWDLPRNLVLFAGSGHAWLGFNYEGRDIPNVVYVEPDDGGDGNNFHVIAETFTEFISKLDDPDKYFD